MTPIFKGSWRLQVQVPFNHRPRKLLGARVGKLGSRASRGEGVLKLADFGLAREFLDHQHLATRMASRSDLFGHRCPFWLFWSKINSMALVDLVVFIIYQGNPAIYPKNGWVSLVYLVFFFFCLSSTRETNPMHLPKKDT